MGMHEATARIDQVTPAAPTRFARTATGRPTGPVPWMLWGAGGNAWVFDARRGLLHLPDFRGENTDNYLGVSSLAPDGRSLDYVVLSREYDFVEQPFTADLITGARGPRPESAYRMPSYSDGRGHRLDIDDRPDGTAAAQRFTLHVGEHAHVLDLGEAIGRNLSGRDVQFSASSGRAVFTVIDRRTEAISTLILDLDNGEVLQRHRDIRLVGSAVWSPDENHLLVEPTRDNPFPRAPHTYDRTAGTLTSLHPLITDRTGEVHIAGWIDNSHLLLSERLGGRLKIIASNLETGTHHELLDLPYPRAAGPDVRGIVMAGHLVQNDPATLLAAR